MLANKVRLGAGGIAPFLEVLTSSRNWIVPDGVFKVDVTLVGGGGGGQNGNDSWSSGYSGGGGGGGGYVENILNVPVTPGASVPVIIGAGGAEGDTFGSDGNKSSFGNLEVDGAIHSTGRPGAGHGGSGGGGGGYEPSSIVIEARGGAGGTNGSDGSADSKGGTPGGSGQGKSTTGINSIRYSGGGGGGNSYSCGSSTGGAGGSGGGGRGGGTFNDNATAATANTGGGGGGGGYDNIGKAGGSGIVIIRYNGV